MVRTPRRVTICADCGREIGVQPDWNGGLSGHRLPGSAWRISAHRSQSAGSRCAGSRAQVPEENVWFNDSKAASS